MAAAGNVAPYFAGAARFFDRLARTLPGQRL
jgi:hypothetical protein